MLRRAAGRRFDVLLLEWLLRNREDTAAAAKSIVHATAFPAVTSLAEDILDSHARRRQVLQGMAA